MWQEPRWTFLRRMFGDEFVQRLFMRCIQWTLICNDIKGYQLYERQDAIVFHLFDQEPTKWFSKYKDDTYMATWDGRWYGYVSMAKIQELAKRVNIFGPIAGVFGRDLEHRIVTRQCVEQIAPMYIESSIINHPGSLHRDDFQEEPRTKWSKTKLELSSSYEWRSYDRDKRSYTLCKVSLGFNL